MNRIITASATLFGIFVGALLVAANLCMADDPTPNNSKPAAQKTRSSSRLPKSLKLTEDQLKSVSPPSEEAIRRQYGHIWNKPDESAPEWEKDPKIIEDAVREAHRLGLDIDDMIIYGDGDAILEAVREAKESGEQKGKPSMKDGKSPRPAFIPFTFKPKADWEKDPDILLDAVEEAERLGLDIDDLIIYGDGEGILEAVRKAKDEEPQDMRSAEPKLKGDDSSHGEFPSTLDAVSDKRSERQQQKVADSAATMQSQTDMTQAAQAGDDAVREAASIIERAGRESQAQSDQSARASAHAARADGWGTTLADAVATGIQQGAEAFGSTLGGAAADKASGEIFGSSRRDSGQTSSEPASGTPSASGAAPSASTTAGAPPPRRRRPASSGTGGSQIAGSAPTSSEGSKIATDPGGRRKKSSGASGDDAGPMVTCPACGRTFRGIAGKGVPCPYCVTMNCPRCGFSKTYKSGQEPSSCPACPKD